MQWTSPAYRWATTLSTAMRTSSRRPRVGTTTVTAGAVDSGASTAGPPRGERVTVVVRSVSASGSGAASASGSDASLAALAFLRAVSGAGAALVRAVPDTETTPTTWSESPSQVSCSIA